MPAETSFPDRLGRGRLLQATVAGFSPAFVPADVSLSAAGFDAFLERLDAIHGAVSTAQAADNGAVLARQAQAAEIKATALRVKDLVQSNIAWKRWHKSVGDAADRVGVMPCRERRRRPETPRRPARHRRRRGKAVKASRAMPMSKSSSTSSSRR